MAWWKRLVGLRPARTEWYCDEHTPLVDHNYSGETIEITYLGTAGFVLKGRERILVLDPYLSRPNLRRTFSARLVPQVDLVRQLIPRADEVLIGHAHYDHVLDAPEVCRHTGARLIGSRSAINVGRAAGLPESQLRETAGREDIACGEWVVRGLPSRHGKVFGRIPFPGDIDFPPPWPPRMGELRHGLVLNWIVDTGGVTVAHIDSADFINDELAGRRCDVLCLCAIGRKYRANYTREAIELLKPRWVIPCHWDTMITPIHEAPDLIPTVDLPGFLKEIRDAGATPLLTPILGRLRFARHAGACPAAPQSMHP